MTKIIFHNHHIIPRHMGGGNEKENLIKLTVEAHTQAHKELYEKFGKHFKNPYRWVTKDGINKRIQPDFLEKYTNSGWTIGRHKSDSQ